MNEDQVIDINLEAVRLEKAGKTEEAVELYEKAIDNNFIGNGAYDRLRIYYRKNKDIENEIRVLEKAVYVFDEIVYKERADRVKKLEKFKGQLEKAYEARDKK